MKKLLACAAIFLTAITTNAQMEKGTVLIGGNLSVGTGKNTTNGSEYKQITLGIAPSVGWAYSTNKFFGFSLNYAYSKQTEDYKENIFGAGVFMRQYMPVAKNLYLFAHEGLNFSAGKGSGLFNATGIGYDVDANKWNATLGLSPGLSYELTKKMQLEVLLNNLLSVGYAHAKSTSTQHNTTSKTEYENNNFSFNSNADPTQLTTVSVGVRFTLGRNKS
jgi:hypothetical protein